LILPGFRENRPHVGRVMGRCIAGTQTGRSDHTEMTRTSASTPLGHTIITTDLLSWERMRTGEGCFISG